MVGGEMSSKDEPLIITEVDRLITTISEHKRITLEDLQRICKIDKKSTDKWVRVLEDEGYVNIEYKLGATYIVWKTHDEGVAQETTSVVSEPQSEQVRKVEEVNDSQIMQVNEAEIQKNEEATPEINKENNEHQIHKVSYNPDWLTPIKLQGQETELYPLYVGKSTNVLKRLGLHLKLKTKHTEWRNSILKGENCLNNDALNKEYGTYDPTDYYNFFSPTTSCQFRAGMELMCLGTEGEDKFWDLLKDNIHFSFLSADSDDKDQFVAHRFYLEDYLIGALRPWFNLDSER